MKSLLCGSADIEEYYRCAPSIVTSIKERPDAKEIFDRIYKELVLPCVELIEAGKNHNAYTKYKSFTEGLQNLVNQ